MTKSIKCLILCSVLVLAGCFTTANYDSIVQSWQGYSIKSLISKWGPPDNSYIGPDGNRVYLYVQRSEGSVPMWGPNGSFLGSSNYITSCSTWFEVDKNNKIIKTFSKGDGCVADKRQFNTMGNAFNPPLTPVTN